MAEILVEFVPDFSKLEAGVDQLVGSNTISKEMAALFTDAGKSLDQFGAKFAKLGGGNTLKPAIDAAKKSIGDLSKSGIKDLGELKKRVDGITKSFIDGFGEGVEQALDEVGVSLQEFNGALKQTEGTGKSLKSELREMTEALAQMKLKGEENSLQYQELSAKAAEYRDAIQDVSSEINKSASDTKKLDTAIEFATGLAASFAVIQGAAALAGDESEEFQKTLLKVNAAMSILAGLQQIQNLLQKESNIIRAITNVQLRAQVVATNLQTAAQSRNVVVSAAATVAMKALNFVMSLNPALILVSAFGLLAGALVYFSGKADSAADRVNELNRALDETGRATDAALDRIRNQAEVVDATLESAGAKQSERTKQRLAFLQKENTQLLISFRKLEQEFDATNNRIKSGEIKKTEEITEVQNKLAEKMQSFQDQFLENNQTIKVETIKLGKTIADENQKALDDSIAKNKEQSEKLEKIREERRQQELAAIRRKLLDAEEGSEQELTLRKQLAIKEGLFEIEKEKLVGDKKKEVLRSVQLEIEKLDKEFGNKRKTAALENELSIINAQLDAIGLSSQEQERLTIERLEKQRQIELAAVVNNKAKEKEINAKFDKEIFEQRKAIRDAAFADELATIERNAFIAKTIAEQNAADETLPIQKRKEALIDLESFERATIRKRRADNEQQLLDGVKSLEDFDKTRQEIDNDAFVSKTKFEKAQTDLVKTENEKRLSHIKEVIGAVAEFASSAIDSLRSFMETIAANEDNRIAAQKDSLERLRQNGIVSQKEYEARLKVIDRLDRQNKQKQAEREKAMALFQALVNGAAAIVEAAPDPFKIVATSVLVAAQIAAIAARQVPKFGKGTKSAPKGFAEVGETGTELIQMNGKYFVADHPQVIWMKGGERVYNPDETKDILTPQANMMVINNSNGHSKGENIDYDKMAKKFGDEIAKHPRLINNIDADGYSQYIIEGLNKSKYLNNRFRF